MVAKVADLIVNLPISNSLVRNSLLKNFFSSGIQAIAVQVIGIVFFYVVSVYLPKDDFGIVSWANAVAIFITMLLSCGLEQVVVRRVARSQSSDWAATAYLFHAFITSLFVLMVLVRVGLLADKGNIAYRYLPLFFGAQAVIYIATPLKQFLNAKERFAPYGVIALIGNILKIALALLCVAKNMIDVRAVALILVACAVFELVALLVYVLFVARMSLKWRVKFVAYRRLLKESFPQYIAVIFDSSLSRMDWILLGILSTSVVTADYSFAYRAFEIARLPMAIIGPVILPRFARLLGANGTLDATKQSLLGHFFAMEMFLVIGIPLVLNILWTPAVGWVTHGKYGASDALQFLLLSVCIPFQFFTNLLWTLTFSCRRYKAVTAITVISALVNIVLNFLLIPLYGGVGAAIAFVITSALQTTLYYLQVKKLLMSFSLGGPALFFAISAGLYGIISMLQWPVLFKVIIALTIYVLICVVTRQVNKERIKTISVFLRR